jgi:hypothetical protein
MKKGYLADTLFFSGTPGWIRTSGFQLRRLTLYPLSYGRLKKQISEHKDTGDSNSNGESSQVEIGVKQGSAI